MPEDGLEWPRRRTVIGRWTIETGGVNPEHGASMTFCGAGCELVQFLHSELEILLPAAAPSSTLLKVAAKTTQPSARPLLPTESDGRCAMFGPKNKE